MLSSLIFALTLAQAAPDAAPAAPDQPMTTATATVASDDSRTPKGAPADDYGFVAWCHGALTGHMALYTQVKPELVSIERPDEVATDEKNDKLQMQAGRDYLALYTRALDSVDHGRAALRERRTAAEAQGSAIWDPFRDATPRNRMWAWVGWDLPGRCETASRMLLTPAGRRAALKASLAESAAAPSGAPVDGAAAATPAAAAPNSIDDALDAAAPPAASAGAPAPTPPDVRGPQ